MLTVLGYAGVNDYGKTLWSARCDCGTDTIAISSQIKSGKTQSCGCLNREVHRKRLTTHGFSNKGGIVKPPPEYNLWINMRQRCEDVNHPKYADYGGRGIKVCARWQSFEDFYVDLQVEIGLKPPNPEGCELIRYWSLDRKNNELGYEPGNIRWANPTEQRLNQRNAHGQRYFRPKPVSSDPQT